MKTNSPVAVTLTLDVCIDNQPVSFSNEDLWYLEIPFPTWVTMGHPSTITVTVK